MKTDSKKIFIFQLEGSVVVKFSKIYLLIKMGVYLSLLHPIISLSNCGG